MAAMAFYAPSGETRRRRKRRWPQCSCFCSYTSPTRQQLHLGCKCHARLPLGAIMRRRWRIHHARHGIDRSQVDRVFDRSRNLSTIKMATN